MLIDQEQVHYVQAEGDYSRIHTYDRSYLSTASLRELEAALPADRFVRIHRSAAVNTSRIGELRSLSHGDFALILKDGTELTLSRAHRPHLRCRNHYEVVGVAFVDPAAGRRGVRLADRFDVAPGAARGFDPDVGAPCRIGARRAENERSPATVEQHDRSRRNSLQCAPDYLRDSRTIAVPDAERPSDGALPV